MDAVVARGEGERPAGKKCIAVGVQRVVRAVDRDRTAGDGQRAVALDALAGVFGRAGAASPRTPRAPLPGTGDRGGAAARGDVERAAQNGDVKRGVDAVVAGFDRDLAAGDIDTALFPVVGVFGMDAVGAGFDRDRAAADADAVLALQALFARFDAQRARGDLKIVFRDEAVTVFADHAQAARAVDRQVAFREDGRIGVHAVGFGELTLCGDAVLRSLREREEELVSVQDRDGRRPVGDDRNAREHQLHLVVVPCVHDDPPVERAAEDIVAPRSDRDQPVGERDALSAAGSRAAGERERHAVLARAAGNVAPRKDPVAVRLRLGSRVFVARRQGRGDRAGDLVQSLLRRFGVGAAGRGEG